MNHHFLVYKNRIPSFVYVMFCHGVNKSPRDGTLPSGKLSHNYGKSQFLMGQSTISMAIFNSFLYVYQRVSRLSSFLICAQSWWGEFFLKGLRYLRTRDKLRRVEAPGAFKDLWDFCWAPKKPDKVYNIYNISLYIYTGVVLHWKTCLEIQRNRVWLDRAGGTAAA